MAYDEYVKWKLSYIILLFALGLTCGCKNRVRPIDENKQHLRLNIHTEPPTVDSRVASDTSSIAIINMCFEGLMKRLKNGNIQPAIAHRVEISDDNLVYTFQLREARWGDGKPVTAYDFEETWKTILDPNFPSGFAYELFVLKNGEEARKGVVSTDEVGVKAIGPRTLRVELKHPIPYFLELTSTPSFLAVPSHLPKDTPKHHYIGNGPYRIDEWKHHNYIVLKKNPLYWDQDAVTLENIHLSIIEDEMTELNMFESGELDWAGSPLSSLPTDALQALAAENRLETYPMSGTYYYIFNATEPPFDNLNLRKAFSLAINRQTIIENIVQSKQSPALSFVPPTIWKSETYFRDNDVEEARRLFRLALEETGLSKSDLEKITLSYNSLSAHHKIAQAIQEQWYRAFGVRVKLANKEWKVFLNELTHKQFHIARLGGAASFQDSIAFLDLFRYSDSRSNYSGWTNEEYTKLISQAEETADPRKREELLHRAEKIFMEEMPITPIYYYTGTYIKKPYVKGVDLNELSHANFKFAYLETR